MRFVLLLLWLSAPIQAATAQATPWPVFVDADWLAENLTQPRVKLIEISDEVSYEFDGHIPGAVPAGKEYWREQGDCQHSRG